MAGRARLGTVESYSMMLMVCMFSMQGMGMHARTHGIEPKRLGNLDLRAVEERRGWGEMREPRVLLGRVRHKLLYCVFAHNRCRCIEHSKYVFLRIASYSVVRTCHTAC
ncbi:hypothetical protein C8Q76DRAFT_716672 [Earliella scabrosa]|nr:hypothetical protein C8Q76DRAFT_716672 [Earliella scabrosa]